MRIRATVAAVSGALALSALAVPAAQADVHASGGDSTYRASVAKILGTGKSAFITSPVAGVAPYKLNVSFSNFKVAKSINAGAGGHLVVPVTYTMTHGTEVNIKASDFTSSPYLYEGSELDPSNTLGSEKAGTCTATSTTTANCKANLDIYPGEGDLTNTDAGARWTAGGIAIAFNGQDPEGNDFDPSKVGIAQQGDLGTTTVRRLSKLTVNATPEPVRKNATITVTGKLTRANWDGPNYTGYATQPVQLQFRKNGASAYTVVKTIKTTASGELKTTVKATVDGFFRYVFAGTATTVGSSAAADFIDVK
ncbi:hypothetical protein ACKI1I_14110 [Streptomyces turgidiscabies]|uniref:Lipoprotein n=1 Tax=Streptomyces turgidiscabies (strain Car8) TaxID=698760 RepID=L7ETC3_STRT8|nr:MULTISPECIES: hypothetical protein [Streptomyces]ELP62114.1 hypothetical protein STRTUCAR8_06161 [Streptomyces turgidiscabies Car8]MDX3493011.1 hypothetical protein [Streptomyces turgidiscabies]GAQ74384.1 hypothetical protein T45_06159 [Streptomyces turgidiscabies]